MYGSASGHYTQMVWQNTREIGCGTAPPGAGGLPYSILVCRYDTSGNYPGQLPYGAERFPPVDQGAARPVDQGAAPPVDQGEAPPVDQGAAPPVDQGAAPPVDQGELHLLTKVQLHLLTKVKLHLLTKVEVVVAKIKGHMSHLFYFNSIERIRRFRYC